MTKPADAATANAHNLPIVEIDHIEPLDILQLLRTIWHGKLLITLTALMCISVATYYAFRVAEPRFSATTTLAIDTNKTTVMDTQQATAGLGRDQASLNTELAVLTSRQLLTQVVNALNLTNDPAFNRYLTPIQPWSITDLRNKIRNRLSGQTETQPTDTAIFHKTVDNLHAAITTNIRRNTYIFQITATTGSPERSVDIANALANLYLQDQLGTKQTAVETSVNWLSGRVYELQLQLEDKETAINALITATPTQGNNTLDALSLQAQENETRLHDLRSARTQIETALTTQNQQSGSLVPTASTQTPDVWRSQQTATAARLTRQIESLETLQQDLGNKLAAQSAGLVQLQQLRREADANRVLYETFLARLQETSIQRDLQHADSRILSAAAQADYAAPRKMLIIAMAALLGLVIGTIAVLLQAAWRTGFTDAGALATTTQHRVIGQLPRMPLRKPAQLLGYLMGKPASATAEALRHIRTSLLHNGTGRPPQVILSTSSVHGEGKTTQSIALAHSLAGLGKTVLLIDADLRQSAFQNYFGKKRMWDFDDVISGDISVHDVVVENPHLGITLLCPGRARQNPADLFANAQYGVFIKSMQSEYDHIVIDAPPVLAVPDARVLACYADQIIYAVRWHKTSQQMVAAGLNLLKNSQTPAVGLVLTQVDAHKMQHYGNPSTLDYGRAYYQN